jgi:hypothetical protein
VRKFFLVFGCVWGFFAGLSAVCGNVLAAVIGGILAVGHVVLAAKAEGGKK